MTIYNNNNNNNYVIKDATKMINKMIIDNIYSYRQECIYIRHIDTHITVHLTLVAWTMTQELGNI